VPAVIDTMSASATAAALSDRFDTSPSSSSAVNVASASASVPVTMRASRVVALAVDDAAHVAVLSVIAAFGAISGRMRLQESPSRMSFS
jgi:hypothetical protein